MSMSRTTIALALLALLPQQGNDELRKALNDEVAGADWIYDDVGAGLAAAKKDGRPVLVVFR
jgi:hypothetical protein